MNTLSYFYWTKCIVINIRQPMSTRSYVLFKMVCIRFMVHAKTQSNFFDALWFTGGHFSKRILKYSYSTKYNEIKINHSDVQKMFLIGSRRM